MIASLSVGHVFVDVGHGLREAFLMFWETLWALVLGFGLSGAIQAFVSRDEMRSRLGDHGPAAVTRAGLYGAASSSCSYAASAMAKSLVARAADFLAAMVFLFASTNLVIELGIVVAVIIGWQFVAAEAVGGIIMIVLLVAVGGLWFRGRALDEARQRAGAADTADTTGGCHVQAAEAGEAAGDDGAGDDGDADGADREASGPGWRRRIRSRAGWADAAGYTMSDITMLRKEMVIGFGVAGFLAELVPNGFWNALFLHGHGFVTTVENVALGPLVAVVSFVCSIGNVPLAAALWKGGISFGGVVSFIFADLITLPLLLIYRKQYGRRMALRMLGVFWLVMSLAGLVTGELFGALGWVPSIRRSVVAADHLRFDATAVVNIVALVAFAVLWWLYRHRDHLGGGDGYAKDPVCGMQVERQYAPASLVTAGERVYFCSEHCRDRFTARVAPADRA